MASRFLALLCLLALFKPFWSLPGKRYAIYLLLIHYRKVLLRSSGFKLNWPKTEGKSCPSTAHSRPRTATFFPGFLGNENVGC